MLEDIQVEFNDTTEVVFNMRYPELSVSVDRFEEDLDIGEVLEQQFDVSNVGNGPMDWWMTKHMTGEAGIIYPWTIRREILTGQMFNDDELRGVVYANERFYISGSNNDQPVIYVLNHDGEGIAIFDQPGDDANGMRDLAYDGELLWGSNPDGIHGMTLDGEVQLTLDLPVNPTNCVTWDSDHNCLWVSSTTSDIVALDREGNEVDVLDRQGLRMYGLSYHPEDPDGHNLYIFNYFRLDDGSHPAIHKMDTETGELMFVKYLDTERGGNPGGAFITDQFDIFNSWVLFTIVNSGIEQEGDRIDIWQMETNTDWMTVEPTQGHLNPDESTDLTLTIDTDGLSEVVWRGEIVFDDSVGVEEVVIPIIVVVGDGNGGNGNIQALNLIEGWNLISLNISPGEEFYAEGEDRGPDVELMTEQLRIDEENHHIQLLKDENGLFYAPAQGFNNIPYWNLQEGYLVKVDEDVEAVWEGELIPADSDIPLEEGWNMVAYFPTYELNASAPDFYVLSPILDNVEFAKDALGRFMVPEWNFSNMIPWREMQGYQVKVDADVVLNYPPEWEEGVDARNEETKQPQRLLHFIRNDVTSNNMSVLITSIHGIKQAKDCEIAAFNSDGQIVGTGIVNSEGQCGLAVWGDDPSTDLCEGLQTGETFRLKLWDARQDRELELRLENKMEGDGLIYETDDFTVLEMAIETSVPEEFYLSDAFPNPFNASTRVNYGLPEAATVNINIYDLNGRLVSTLINGKLNVGYHSVIWDGRSNASGIYFIKMSAGDFRSIRKVTLLK